MSKKLLLTLCLSLLPLLSHAVWVDSKGKPLPDKPSRQTLGEFGTQIMLIANEAKLAEQWQALRLPTKVDKAVTARRGDSVSAVLFFFGCAPNKAGKCDVGAEFTLITSDGKKLAPIPGKVWDAAPPPKGMPELSSVRMKIQFDDTDAPGEYSVEAKITDKVSGKVSSVVASLDLKADKTKKKKKAD